MTLRLISLFFALNIYSQFTRALGDAPKLIGELAKANFDGIFSIFGKSTIFVIGLLRFSALGGMPRRTSW